MKKRMQLLVIVIYACCAVAGLTFFKLGSTQQLSLEITARSIGLKISWLSILGMLMYVVSFLIYLSLVAKNNLTYLTPVSSGVVYILTLIVSLLVFKERLTVNQAIGWCCILVGLFFMNKK